MAKNPLPLLLGPVPPALLQPFVTLGILAMRQRHPRLFERMGLHGNKTIRIEPSDLPFVFLLEPKADNPALSIHKPHNAPRADACIRGSLSALLALAEGREDGDTLFFNRELVFSGDTEAVIALRNAVDSARINLVNDLAYAFGPFEGPAKFFGEKIKELVQ